MTGEAGRLRHPGAVRPRRSRPSTPPSSGGAAPRPACATRGTACGSCRSTRSYLGCGRPGARRLPPLSEIPRTTKPAHRVDEAAHPPFGRHRTVGLDDARRLGVSTGTTGAPTFIFYGRRDLDAMVRDQQAQQLAARDARRRSLHAQLAAVPLPDVGARWAPVSRARRSSRSRSALRSRPRPRPSTCASGSGCDPTGFMMTASQFQTYERVGDEIGIDFARLRRGPPARVPRPRLPVRRAAAVASKTAYGVRLHNLSGASEVPAFSVNDSRFHRGFQAAGDHVVIEVVRPRHRRTRRRRVNAVISSCRPSGSTPVTCATTSRTSSCGSPTPTRPVRPVDRYRLIGRGADAVRVDGRRSSRSTCSSRSTTRARRSSSSSRAATRRRCGVRVEHEGRRRRARRPARGAARDADRRSRRVAPGSLPRAAFKPRRIAWQRHLRGADGMGRRVLVTGASGVFGRDIAARLRACRCRRRRARLDAKSRSRASSSWPATSVTPPWSSGR